MTSDLPRPPISASNCRPILPSIRAEMEGFMADLFDNPLGTDGFEFVEFTSPDPRGLGAQFEHTFVVMNGAPIVLT